MLLWKPCAVSGRETKVQHATVVCTAQREAVQLPEQTNPFHPLTALCAFAGAYSSTYHPDWSILAARIVVSDLHKQTEDSFSKLAKKLHNYKHPITGTNASLLAEDVAQIIADNAERLDAAIKYERDFECVRLRSYSCLRIARSVQPWPPARLVPATTH
jgi:hypothetical protein